jgi:hypothetical protein
MFTWAMGRCSGLWRVIFTQYVYLFLARKDSLTENRSNSLKIKNTIIRDSFSASALLVSLFIIVYALITTINEQLYNHYQYCPSRSPALIPFGTTKPNENESWLLKLPSERQGSKLPSAFECAKRVSTLEPVTEENRISIDKLRDFFLEQQEETSYRKYTLEGIERSKLRFLDGRRISKEYLLTKHDLIPKNAPKDYPQDVGQFYILTRVNYDNSLTVINVGIK